MKQGIYVTFLGTLGTASILLWGLSQGRAKPEYSPTYIQVQSIPKTVREVAVGLASKPRGGAVKSLRRLTKDVTVKNLCKLRTYAAIAPDVPVSHVRFGKSAGGLGSRTEIKSAQFTRVTPKPRSMPVEAPRHLDKDVTVKNLCKLRTYAALEPKEPVYRLASKEEGEEPASSAEVTVTPFIRDIMNKVRPKQITGTIKVEGKEYEFGSGGRGQSIPYGDYLITPDAVGSWGSRHGAIGVANGTIPDPKLHRDRDGIELHAATNDKLVTDGCVSIRKDQWPEFRKQVLGMLKQNKKIYLHVSDQGASVSTNPFEFIGETIARPTFRDVLSLLERPAAKRRSD
jgi:hypothetical protein